MVMIYNKLYCREGKRWLKTMRNKGEYQFPQKARTPKQDKNNIYDS